MASGTEIKVRVSQRGRKQPMVANNFSFSPLQSAVGFDYKGEVEKHASQKGE